MNRFIILSIAAIALLSPPPCLGQSVDAPEGMTMDQVIAEAANSSTEFEFFYSDMHQDAGGPCTIRVELDIEYSCEEWQALMAANESDSSSAGRKKRTAGIRPGAHGGRRWTSNRINYYLQPGHFSSRDRGVIQQALADWSRYTCLTFSENSRASNKVRVQNSGGCHSRVGMTGGTQVLGLAPGCRYKGTVIHEFGHAIGLHHEQTRPDRDNHVIIVKRNIPPRVLYNFDRYTWSVLQNMNIPYDYSSIMHYGAKAFSLNGGYTIQTKNSRYQNVIGQTRGLSFRDIKSVNIMYNCAARCAKKSCPGEGFVGKDCQCWCPGSGPGDPYRRCSGTTTGTTRRPTGTTRRPTTPRPTGSCTDQNRHCRSWAAQGECRANPSYMHVYCKKSCQKCSGGGGGTRPTTSCTNSHRHCTSWARTGYCRSGAYRSYMQSNCKKACGLCRSGYGSSAAASCTDSSIHCPYWARIGECQRNPLNMHVNCKRSCNTCNSGSANAAMSPVSSSCTDASQNCASWASQGECTRNPAYMLTSCRRSCRQC